MISVIISWWSSPVHGTATYGVTPLCSPEYEKCQLCVYSEIALIKWPRRPIAIGLLRMIIITIYARPCTEDKMKTTMMEEGIYQALPLNWRETGQGFCFCENYGRFNNSKLWCVWSGNNEFPPPLSIVDQPASLVTQLPAIIILIAGRVHAGMHNVVQLNLGGILLKLSGNLVPSKWRIRHCCSPIHGVRMLGIYCL